MAGEIVVIHSTTSFAQKMSNRIKRLQMMDFKKMVSGLWQSGALSAFMGGVAGGECTVTINLRMIS